MAQLPRPVGRRRRGILVTIPIILALAPLTACGGDGEALPESVEFVAADFAFENVPERIGTDTTLTMRNESDVEVHELVAFALPHGVEGSAADILALPEDELDAFMGGPPALVVLAPPNGDSFVPIGDGTLPEPGRYLLFCAIPTGADPNGYLAAAAESDRPPEVEGGPPHFLHGMAATVEVVES